MIEECQCDLVLTQRELSGSTLLQSVRSLVIENLLQADPSHATIRDDVNVSDLAYAVFTSGMTVSHVAELTLLQEQPEFQKGLQCSTPLSST